MNTSYKVSILIVDDHLDSRFAHHHRVSSLFKEVASEELNIVAVGNIEDMYKALKQESFHVILLDRDLGKESGGDMIDGIEQIPRILEFDQILGFWFKYPTTSLAVEPCRVKDFMTKSSDEEKQRYCDEQILQALRESQLEVIF